MGLFRRSRDPLEREVAEVASYPRYRKGPNHAGRLCVGHVIDWLRAHRDDDLDRGRALLRYARSPQNDSQRAAYAAAALARLDSPPNWSATEIHPHGSNHLSEYGPRYHALVVGWADAGGVAVAESTYRALLSRRPDDYAGLANVAELERRAGRRDDALELACRASELAHERDTSEHLPALGAANEPVRWRVPLACLRARIEGATDVRARAYLLWASERDFHRIISELRDSATSREALIATHAAIGSAAAEERIWLRVCLAVSDAPYADPPLYPGGPREFDAVRARSREAHVIAQRRAAVPGT